MIHHRLRAAVVATLVACTAPAAWGYDLLQAYRDAQANDAVLAASRAQLQATRENVPIARSALLPVFGASATLQRQEVDLVNPTNALANRQFSLQSRTYGISLSQPLFRLQNIEAYEQSKLGVAQAEAAFANAQQDLALRVAQAYFDALAAQDSLFTIRSQKRAIAEQLESAKRSFEVGTATVTDQQEAQARFDLATAQEIGAENDLRVRRAALELLVGRPVGDLKGLPRAVELQPPQPSAEAPWVNDARLNSYAVQQALLGSEIARREITRQRYAHFPTLDLVGQLNRTINPNVQLPNATLTSSVVGLQLAIPIYAGGGVDARTRQAAASLDQSLANLETARRQAELGARQAFIGLTSGLAQVRALEAAERSSQLALDSNLLGYEVGVRINIDVLNAQQQLFTTRQNLARARYNTLVGALQLAATTATLGDDDVARINALLADVPPEPEVTIRPVPLQGGGARGAAAAGSSLPGGSVPGAVGGPAGAGAAGGALGTPPAVTDPGPTRAVPRIGAPGTPSQAVPGAAGPGTSLPRITVPGANGGASSIGRPASPSRP